MSRTELTPAVLLRSVAYGEADRIVTLFTASRGKVALYAKHARKSTKRFGAALEPYALIEAEIAIGRGDLGRLASARVLRAFPGVLADLERMSVAAAGLELVRESIGEREPEARVLPAVERFFELVAEMPARREPFVPFALRVLAILGLGPNLEQCGHCGRRAPDSKAAFFDPALGALSCRRCGGGPIELTGALRARLIRAGTREWDDIAASEWTDDERTNGRRALDDFLARHVPHRLSGADLVTQVREVRLSYERKGENG